MIFKKIEKEGIKIEFKERSGKKESGKERIRAGGKKEKGQVERKKRIRAGDCF